MRPDELLQSDFADIAALIRAHAVERPDAAAIHDGGRTLSYGELSQLIDRASMAFLRDGMQPGDAVAMCAGNSTDYIVALLGAVGTGLVVCPLAPSLAPDQLARMLDDCEARCVVLDNAAALPLRQDVRRIFPEESGNLPFADWLADDVGPTHGAIAPDHPFNIIYSSGTTGAPKGIIQSHLMRWRQVAMLRKYGFERSTVTILSTPLYSNTTLAALFPTLACGGAVVLIRKFDARGFLEIAQGHRATHAMLVPVQFRRIMDVADFDRFDLSAFVMKFAASAPFSAEIKADVLARWPGGLIELYGATEGGGLCVLEAHRHPDKLATVGLPYPGHDIRLIRDDDSECGPDESGEVVGRSGAMMAGYHKDPVRTAQAEWFSADGLRYLRMGDIGRFDDDGFLSIVDRKKDMIISGGFNIYSSDVEAVLESHPAVLEAAVVGIPSDQWGETPVAFITVRDGMSLSGEAIEAFAGAGLGRTQRPSRYHFVAGLPRSTIGKVLKNELRQQAIAAEGSA